MKMLIIKLGATGDVVRTTTVLGVLDGEIDWLSSDKNTVMLKGNPTIRQCMPWTERHTLKKII